MTRAGTSCAGRARARYDAGDKPCAHYGTIEEDGKKWCRAHAPSNRKKFKSLHAMHTELMALQERCERAEGHLLSYVLLSGKVDPRLWALATDARTQRAELKKKIAEIELGEVP